MVIEHSFRFSSGFAAILGANMRLLLFVAVAVAHLVVYVTVTTTVKEYDFPLFADEGHLVLGAGLPVPEPTFPPDEATPPPGPVPEPMPQPVPEPIPQPQPAPALPSATSLFQLPQPAPAPHALPEAAQTQPHTERQPEQSVPLPEPLPAPLPETLPATLLVPLPLPLPLLPALNTQSTQSTLEPAPVVSEPANHVSSMLPQVPTYEENTSPGPQVAPSGKLALPPPALGPLGLGPTPDIPSLEAPATWLQAAPIGASRHPQHGPNASHYLNAYNFYRPRAPIQHSNHTLHNGLVRVAWATALLAVPAVLLLSLAM